MVKRIKKLIKKVLRKAGLDLVRYEPQTKTSSSLPMYDDPLEALCTLQGGGESAAFECPLDKTIHRKGFRWGSSKGWHPFVETLKEYESGMTTCYDNSILKKYYEKHQPENASNALIGFNNSPNIFQEYPSYGYRLSPWRYTTMDKIYESVKYWTNKDNKEHGQPNVTFSSGGKKVHGPVSNKKGKLEYERLTSVYESIKSEGYIRDEGLPHFRVLKRGNEYLFRPVRRKHRIAAMSALGYDYVPATYDRIAVIDIEMAKWWPQVSRGKWSLEKSKNYFDYLFDFDSLKWALERGLIFK